MFRLTAGAAIVFACAFPAAAADPYDDLLKHASANTNALVLIDVKKASASPLAKKEKWAEKVRESGHGGLGFFPVDAERVAIAGEINLTLMVRDFQVGLVKVNNLPNFKELAAQEGGAMSEIGGQLTVVSPRSVYFTTFSGGTLAAAYPADRQYVSRWLKADKAGKLPPLAPSLRAAADAAGDDAVTIALDLEDVVDPGALQVGLSVSPVMAKNKGVNQRALAVFLSRVRSLSFGARLAEGVSGTLTVEFADDPNRYRSILKDLFLEVIDGYGISIAGIDAWEAKFTDKTMTLTGPMQSDDLKRVVGLFAFPRPDDHTAAAGGPDDGPNAAATKRYMSAVAAILEDIKHVKDSSSYGKTATWHDQAAARLEELSRRNVDPLAVDAAYEASAKLRQVAGSLRGVPVDTNAAAQKAYMYTQRQPNYGWGGWWGGYRGLAFAPSEVRSNVPQVKDEMAKAVAGDQKRRIATWVNIDQLMVDTRRKLSDKYKTDF